MAFDEVSSPALAYKFSNQEFTAETYIKDLSKKCDTYRDLRDHRHQVATLGEETAVSMKKNVYRNYTQFIDTSKEISYLEAEMYQLSHLLTEQKGLLVSQMEMSLIEKVSKADSSSTLVETGNADQHNFSESPQEISEIIEASKHFLDSLSQKKLLMDNLLVEINPDTYAVSQKVRAFLFNDCLLITTYPMNRSGSGKFQLQTAFDLGDLAVVNVRDGQGIKNAFKVLQGLDTRMFGSETTNLKLKWLDAIEVAKKNHKDGASSALFFEPKDTAKKDEKESMADSYNPFEDSGDEEVNQIVETPKYPNLLEVDWLIELPEDLEVKIAEHNFQAAVEAVERANSYLKDFPESQKLIEIRSQINTRVTNLCNALENSLDNSTIFRHVSLRSIRESVMLLIRLGREKLACDLFLKNRGNVIKHTFRQLKIEGATALYVGKLANVFFLSIIESGKEYFKTFPKNSHASAFIVWAHKELQHFVSKFVRQVFTRTASLSAIAVCVDIAMSQCRKLFLIGLDLTFDMHHMLLKHILEAMLDCRDHLLEGSKHRANEDTWTPLDYSLQQDQLTVVVSEFHSLGLDDIDMYISDGEMLLLSHSTVAFVKGVLSFLNDGLKLYSVEMYNPLVQCILELFKMQAVQLQMILKAGNHPDQTDFIANNAEFIFTDVLHLTENKLKDRVGHRVEAFAELDEELRHLRKLASKSYMQVV